MGNGNKDWETWEIGSGNENGKLGYGNEKWSCGQVDVGHGNENE